MQAEVGALHEAMAGLHGEMGVVQRELDGAKLSKEKLAKGKKDVTRHSLNTKRCRIRPNHTL